MKEQGKTLETVEIVGERAVVDLESGKSGGTHWRSGY